MSRPERHLRVAPACDENDNPGSTDAEPVPGEMYLISIRGSLGAALCDSFAPLDVAIRDGRTELRGLVEDQGSLYGILTRIQSLGLPLDEVVRLRNSPRDASKN